jgi:chromosome segregation ATPase
MDEREVQKQIEEAKASNCAMHQEVWTDFTTQLNKLTSTQTYHDKEIEALRDNVKELQKLTLAIQEQNFKIDRVLDSLNDRRSEIDALFSKARIYESKFSECPLHKERIENRFVVLDEDLQRSKEECKKEREKFQETIEQEIEDKIYAVASGQTLFRWILSLFLLITVSVVGYNIDQTMKATKEMQRLNVQIEKQIQRSEYMSHEVTKNTNDIAEYIHKR